MGKYLYKIKIIEENHPAYGMEGEVFAVDYLDGELERYHVLFFGYENCKKVGYTEPFISRVNLANVGFSYIISPSKCEILIDYSKVN